MRKLHPRNHKDSYAITGSLIAGSSRFSTRLWQSETNREIETLSHLRRHYKDTALQSGLGFALPMIYRVCSSILFCILKYVFISLVEKLHA